MTSTLRLTGEPRKGRYRNAGRRERTVFAGGVFVMFRRRYYYDRLERRYVFPLDVVLAWERKASLRPDGATCEAMIDEKFASIWHEKGKRPIYTATVHAGLGKGPGGRNSLRIKTVLCSLDLTERFVSGDLAAYIRSFPGSEEGPGFRYVPDKWHVCRARSLLSPGGKRVKAAGVKAFLSSIARSRGSSWGSWRMGPSTSGTTRFTPCAPRRA